MAPRNWGRFYAIGPQRAPKSPRDGRNSLFAAKKHHWLGEMIAWAARSINSQFAAFTSLSGRLCIESGVPEAIMNAEFLLYRSGVFLSELVYLASNDTRRARS
jgi:hypothetical protein